MRWSGAFAIATVALASGGCFPLVTPPIKADLGYAGRVGGDSGYRWSVGTDVASLIPDADFPLQAGAGYVQTSTRYGRDQIPVHGVYLEGGPKVASNGDWWRVFVGPRAEYYFAPKGTDPAYAGLVRGQFELFGFSGVKEHIEDTSSDAKSWWGVAFGTFGVGAYVEAGYQHLPNEAGLPLVGGGLYLRLPATAGIVCCIWDFASKSKSQ